MPIERTYDKELNILTCQVIGRLSIDDYKKSMAEVTSSNEHPSDISTIWDLRKMRFDNIDLEFEEQVIAIRCEYNEQRGNAKIALVCDYHLAEPIIKLFKVLSKPLIQNVRSFYTVEEATNWIKSEQ